MRHPGLAPVVGLIATLTACASMPAPSCKSGEWRGDGTLVRESSYLRHLVHAADAPSEKNVAELVGVYKERFQQACVSF
jgi:hypothetical protein